MSVDWLPNAFIIGAPKAGTTSLHQWLADHPDAFGATGKETYFMVDPGTHMYRPDRHITRGLDAWAPAFPIPASARPTVILESTPGHLYADTALTRIPDLPSEPKCICLLREPAAQIHSLYTYFRDNWDWIPHRMSFAEYLTAAREGQEAFNGNELARDALRNAAYVDVLTLWLDRLGPERLFVATFDALVADKQGLTRRIAAWLGLDPSFYDSYAFPLENETYAPRSRALQRLNIALRGRLSKGPFYARLRNLYRRLNTTPGAEKTAEDDRLLAELRKDYADANTRLAQTFGLTLAGWELAGRPD